MIENEGRLSRSQNQPAPDSSNARQLAAISYVWVFSLFVLLARRENGFIQHHARRGVVLFALSLLFWWIPILHYGEILVLAVCVMGFIQASMGNEFHMPLLSEISDGSMARTGVEGVGGGGSGNKGQSGPGLGVPKAEESSERMRTMADRLARDEEEIRRLEAEVNRLEEEIHKPKN